MAILQMNSRFNVYFGLSDLIDKKATGVWLSMSIPDPISVSSYGSWRVPSVPPSDITLEGLLSADEHKMLQEQVYCHPGIGVRKFAAVGILMACERFSKFWLADGAFVRSINSSFGSFGGIDADADDQIVKVEITLACDRLIESDSFLDVDALDDETLSSLMRSEGWSPVDIVERLASRPPKRSRRKKSC